MPYILDFINKNSKVLLFLILMGISLGLMFQYQGYHQTKLYKTLFNSQSALGTEFSAWKSYFALQSRNQILQKENAELHEYILNHPYASGSSTIKTINDSLQNHQTYQIIPARVINTTHRNVNNYYTLNVGSSNRIQEGLGVVTEKGIVGHIALLSEDYSLVLSTLHPATRIKSKIKNTEYFGTLMWNGKDARVMQLMNIDKYIEIKLGDTIETYRSTIFPEGYPVGKVIDKQIDLKSGKWDLSVQLFQDLNSLNNVYIINNLEKAKIDSLEIKAEIFDAE